MVSKIPIRKFRKRKLLHVQFGHTNFRINRYLPRAFALLNELKNDGRIDVFCNSDKNIKSFTTKDIISSTRYYYCCVLVDASF